MNRRRLCICRGRQWLVLVRALVRLCKWNASLTIHTGLELHGVVSNCGWRNRGVAGNTDIDGRTTQGSGTIAPIRAWSS